MSGARAGAAGPALPRPALRRADVRIGPARLPGHWTTLPGAHGVVVFAHGSGSSRLSPRNRGVAEVMQQQGLSTLLFDLLTADEAADRANVFDVALLARRVGDALAWLGRTDALPPRGAGLFGASTGAAAALVAAAAHPVRVGAVVSRGGRPDLAGDALERVLAPTLLIVGGADTQVLALNRAAERRLGGPHRLEVVPGASHLFEEPGTLASVSHLAARWFVHHLDGRSPT